jgi:hypothetical protein
MSGNCGDGYKGAIKMGPPSGDDLAPACDGWQRSIAPSPDAACGRIYGEQTQVRENVAQMEMRIGAHDNSTT